MEGYINNYDFVNLEAMKYYAPPNSWSVDKRKSEVQTRIFSGTWMGSRKMDGYFERFVKDEDGNMYLLARSKNVQGVYPNKIEWVPQLDSFFNALPNGTVLLGEVYFPNNEGSKNTTSILGCLKDKAIKRQEAGDYLHYYIFDVLAFRGENLINRPIKERVSYLDHIAEIAYDVDNSFIHTAQYYYGNELWSELQSILSSGGEGMVITREDCEYKPGKRSVKDTFKCKQELTDTIDCFIIGANAPTRNYEGKSIETWKYWEDIKTGEKFEDMLYKEYRDGRCIEPITKNYFHGWAGSLKLGLMKDGQPIYFGDLSGLTEEILNNWKNYLGHVCEVGGMSLDEETRHIRHPRFLGWREDKTKDDCQWSQVE